MAANDIFRLAKTTRVWKKSTRSHFCKRFVKISTIRKQYIPFLAEPMSLHIKPFDYHGKNPFCFVTKVMRLKSTVQCLLIKISAMRVQ